jgi:hypothetical protein
LTSALRFTLASRPTCALLLVMSSSLCAMVAYAQTLQTRPDALLQIDLNRAAVVERIMTSWNAEFPAGKAEAFKQKLMALRSDQLLAANVSGSFDGVLEVMDSAEKAAAFLNKTDLQAASEQGSADRAKAVGDKEADLVYTPVTPCRFLDTRGSNLR